MSTPAQRPDRVPAEVLRFAREVGDEGPVAVVGGGTQTQATMNQEPHESPREVRAPAGVWEYEPSEMTVRCGAGTTLRELDEVLGAASQMVPFDQHPDATVGGVLSVGDIGYRRFRYGHVRDFVLQTRHVDAAGEVVTAGGPTVKNVSGYDLPRLLVGSGGTLGFIAEVILRCVPVPPAKQWFSGREVDPFELHGELYRPSAILAGDSAVWVLLEGHPDDIEAEAKAGAMSALSPCEPPSWLPPSDRYVCRTSHRPSALRDVLAATSGAVAEVGVGVVHHTTMPAVGSSSETLRAEALRPANISLMETIKAKLDPTGRLNPQVRCW